MDSEEGHLGSWDGSEGEDDDVGNIGTGRVVISLGDIGGDSGDVSGDLWEVLDDVGGNQLDKSEWVLDEAGEPGGDSGEVTLHIFAVGEVSWELGEEGSDNFDSGKDGSNISLHEVGDGLVDFLLDAIGIGEAGLDVLEVILLDETVEHTGNELLGLLNGDGVVVGDDGESDGGKNLHV